jgi:hypothetical protein
MIRSSRSISVFFFSLSFLETFFVGTKKKATEDKNLFEVAA